MKRNIGLMFCGFALLSVVSCFDPSQPNYQYFPDMYESVGYDTYAEAPFFNGTAAQLPVEGSIPRGWQPYDYPNTNEGYELETPSFLWIPTSGKVRAMQDERGNELTEAGPSTRAPDIHSFL